MTGFRALLAADISSNKESAGLGAGLQFLLSVRGLATVLLRVSHAAYTAGGVGRIVGLAVKQLNQVITGVDVAPDATIGPGLRIYHTSGVVIGPGVCIGRNCTIQSDVVVGGTGGPIRGANGAPVLGHDVQLGTGAKIIGNLIIADGVAIGANAVVLDSITVPRALAVGVPARIIERTSEPECLGQPAAGVGGPVGPPAGGPTGRSVAERTGGR